MSIFSSKSKWDTSSTIDTRLLAFMWAIQMPHLLEFNRWEIYKGHIDEWDKVDKFDLVDSTVESTEQSWNPIAETKHLEHTHEKTSFFK